MDKVTRVKCSVCRSNATHRGELDFGGALVPYCYCERHYKQHIVKTGLKARVKRHESSSRGFVFSMLGMKVFFSRAS